MYTFYAHDRPVEDVHPGWRLPDWIWAVPAAESFCGGVAAQKTQTKAEAEDHQPEQCGSASGPRGPSLGTLSRRRHWGQPRYLLPHTSVFFHCRLSFRNLEQRPIGIRSFAFLHGLLPLPLRPLSTPKMLFQSGRQFPFWFGLVEYTGCTKQLSNAWVRCSDSYWTAKVILIFTQYQYCHFCDFVCEE